MAKRKVLLFVGVGLLTALRGVWAEGGARCPAKEVARVDGLFEKAYENNYRRSALADFKEAVDECSVGLEKCPGDYELLWKCARCAHGYGEAARNLLVEGWEAVCREWGKQGMEWAEQAQQVDPSRVEGYFWEAACIGIYADGTGVLTAIKEGFYNKSKRALAKAYELDKSYNDYDPVFAEAMFWITLPFPMRDKKKALGYYREFEANTAWKVKPYTRCVYAADLLMSVKPKHYKEEARRLLERALTNPHPVPYYDKWARKLVEKLR